MGRVQSARTGHVLRWVLPAANRLLIEAATRRARTARLAAVADIVMGSSPKGDTCNSSGEGVPLLGGPADLGIVQPEPSRWTTAPTKMTRADDILVCVRATIGEPRWSDGQYCLGRGLAAIRPRDGNVDRRFLFHVIEGNQDWLRSQGTGTTFKTISKQHLDAIAVPMLPKNEQTQIGEFLECLARFDGDRVNFDAAPPLPAYLSEQRRIVAKIEQLAAKIDEARGLRHRSVAEVEVLSRSSSSVAFEDDETFERVRLEEVCTDIVDCLHSNPVYSESGVPTVRSPDVGWGTLMLDAARKTSEQEFQRRTRRGAPMPGDLILVREGGGTGKAGLVEQGQRLSLGQRVMQLTPNRERVLSRFLLHQWLSPLIQHDQIAERMKGSASPHLNIKALRKFSFILPPIDEQRRIVAYLDDLQAKVDRLKALQAQTSAELDALLPSILDKAFKGAL